MSVEAFRDRLDAALAVQLHRSFLRPPNVFAIVDLGPIQDDFDGGVGLLEANVVF